MATNHWNNLNSMLKELYTGETWAVKEYKAGRLTDLEIALYASEIDQYHNLTQSSLYKDLVYVENPLLKLINKAK